MNKLEEKMTLQENTYQLWTLYVSSRDEKYFEQYIDEFVSLYSYLIDADVINAVADGRRLGPHYSQLPEALFPSLSSHLKLLTASLETEGTCDESRFQSLKVYLQLLVILTRNEENISNIETYDLVDRTVHVIRQLFKLGDCVLSEHVEGLIHLWTKFLECLYDPQYLWRTSVSSPTPINVRGQKTSKAAPLHNEVIPFVYECLVDRCLSPVLRASLVHLFGAILSGRDANIVLCVTPATLRMLFHQVHMALGASSDGEDMAALCRLVIRCVVRVVPVVLAVPSDELQVDTTVIVKDYAALLHDSFQKQVPAIQLELLTGLLAMLAECPLEFVVELQLSFTSAHMPTALINALGCMSETHQSMIILVIQIIAAMTHDCPEAATIFTQIKGEELLIDQLRRFGEPWPELRHMLVEMMVLDDWLVRPALMKMLIQWVPELSGEAQDWFMDKLLTVCKHSYNNKMASCQKDVIDAILDSLINTPQENKPLRANLMALFNVIGAVSISAHQVKKMFQIILLHPHLRTNILRAFSVLICSEGPKHLVELRGPDAGIIIPKLRRWSTSGFSFFAWIRLIPQLSAEMASQSRLLFRFQDMTGLGIVCTLVTASSELVVTSTTKRGGSTSSSFEATGLFDGAWHLVTVCHAPGKKPFGQSLLSVHVDGTVGASSNQVKYPNINCDSDTNCCIGGEGGGVAKQSRRFLCLFGSFISACLLSDYLTSQQIRAIYLAGYNALNVFDSDELSVLASKRLLHYHAKATKGPYCYDLSPDELHAKLNGDVYHFTTFRESLNSVGGVQTMLPLFEHIKPEKAEGGSPTGKATASADSSVADAQVDEIENPNPDEWVVVQKHSDSEEILRRNPVATLIRILCRLVERHPRSRDELVRQNSVRVIGHLLQQIDASFIDAYFLNSMQDLIESCSSFDSHLVTEIYEYILFDFSIWCRSEFAIRIGHIQYLRSIIKDHKSQLRDRFGVQFILDTIRNHYSENSTQSPRLPEADVRVIRGSLLNLIKFLIKKTPRINEIQEIFNFLAANSTDHDLTSDVLDLLAEMLQNPATGDQLFLKIMEPGIADGVYNLIVHKKVSATNKEKTIKIVPVLLKSTKIYDKHKSRLRLDDVGFLGLVCKLKEENITQLLAANLFETAMLADPSNRYTNVLGLCQLCHKADSETKASLAKKVLATLFSNRDAALLYAKEPTWHQSLLGLVTVGPKESSDTLGSVFGDAEPSQVSTDDVGEDVFPDSQLASNPASAASEECSKPLEMNAKGLESVVFRNPLRRSQYSYSELTLRGDKEMPRRSSMLPIRTGQETNVLWQSEASTILAALDGLGLELNATEKGHRKESDLMQTTISCVFAIMWEGLNSWESRSDVFAVLRQLTVTHEFVESPDEVTRRLLELLLKACLVELKRDGRFDDYNTRVAVEVLRLVQDFITSDDAARITDSLLEAAIEVLDAMMVFDDVPTVDTELSEVSTLGLTILSCVLSHSQLSICSLASARLHSLLHSRRLRGKLEASYLLYSLNDSLKASITDQREHYAFLLPVMKALTEKSYQLLQMDVQVPNNPCMGLSASLPEEFEAYCQGSEWSTFIEKQVKPLQDEFVKKNLVQAKATMEATMTQKYKTIHMQFHRRNRAMGEDKLRFENKIMEPWRERLRQEKGRYQNMLTSQRARAARAKHLWLALKRYQTRERGAWFNGTHEPTHWRLTAEENFQRMRCKLVENIMFDDHHVASFLRDHHDMPSSELSSLISLKLKEALVGQVNEDTVAEEEVAQGPASPTAAALEQRERSLLSTNECQFIRLGEVIAGTFELTNTHLYFTADQSLIAQQRTGASIELHNQWWEEGEFDFKVPLEELREVHLRRFNLRRSALEFFLIDQTNFFLNFNKNLRNIIYQKLQGLHPSNMIYHGARSPMQLYNDAKLQERWVLREISNFDYLMLLNTIAGRTYNDLSQYPVFPWILADYTSPTLDLTNPDAFRDLARPVGIIKPKHEQEVRMRYDTFEDPSGIIAKFHYGTHYSNAAGVIHFMIRLEPFTTQHIQLQSGKFDFADRQFHSVGAAWLSVLDSPNDVKELIPEFFYMPEFLENSCGFDFGRLQMDGSAVNDVVLPAWAETAEDFVHLHRQALESDNVSEFLHNWIDLIFGYKQQGPAAVEALNVFMHYSYEGAVDVDAISDPVERRAVEGIINNFGQTPCQLLKEPHPKRLGKEEAEARWNQTGKLLSALNYLKNLKAYSVELVDEPLVFVSVPRNQTRSILAQVLNETMLTVTATGTLAQNPWLPQHKSTPQYFTFEKDPSLINPRNRKRLPGPFHPETEVRPEIFAVTPSGRAVFVGGVWNNAIAVYSTSRNRMQAQFVQHTDVVSCIVIDHNGLNLVSGSRDCTCIIWRVNEDQYQLTVRWVLYGHEAEVSSVAISTELDMVVSGSKDGTCNIHTVRKGQYVRTIYPPGGDQVVVKSLRLSSGRHLVVYTVDDASSDSKSRYALHLYSINGKHICTEKVDREINDMLIRDSFLITGNSAGVLSIRELFRLKTLRDLPLQVKIRSVALARQATHILVGLENGWLIVIGVTKSLTTSGFSKK